MNIIERNIQKIKSKIPQHTQFIVVSKYREITEIQDVYNLGQRHFAENRVQALLERKESLPQDIKWHLIGHLQTNKVKFIAPFIHLIQSVDSLKLADEINKQAAKNNRIIDVLLQTHVAQEESKFGVTPAAFPEFIESLLEAQFKNVRFCGIMGMATFTDNHAQIKDEFQEIRQLFDVVKQKYFETDPNFKEISIGMSGDYELAIEAGSTMVRIGSAVFES